ncbi:hypothetical protein GCM10022244_01010 [Streptomyces gulbargensis]|uniref:Uncharacterized protein n=1 Tax=Streptomyces gulbargensis TaxID=364901 RepID=A0ABP7L4T6_9ACTN
MQSAPEPELPDPVPADPDAVTPDLPAPGPEAPDIRIAGRDRPRTEDAEGDSGDAAEETAGHDEGQEAAERRDDGTAVAGPGTPAPQEQSG